MYNGLTPFALQPTNLEEHSSWWRWLIVFLGYSLEKVELILVTLAAISLEHLGDPSC